MGKPKNDGSEKEWSERDKVRKAARRDEKDLTIFIRQKVLVSDPKRRGEFPGKAKKNTEPAHPR
jgi:hypothetical protein